MEDTTYPSEFIHLLQTYCIDKDTLMAKHRQRKHLLRYLDNMDISARVVQDLRGLLVTNSLWRKDGDAYYTPLASFDNLIIEALLTKTSDLESVIIESTNEQKPTNVIINMTFNGCRLNNMDVVN